LYICDVVSFLVFTIRIKKNKINKKNASGTNAGND
jgi:hypothetical protein